jgi:hypothetical protein
MGSGTRHPSDTCSARCRHFALPTKSMVPPIADREQPTPGFFDSLPLVRHASETFDAARFRAAPDETGCWSSPIS